MNFLITLFTISIGSAVIIFAIHITIGAFLGFPITFLLSLANINVNYWCGMCIGTIIGMFLFKD